LSKNGSFYAIDHFHGNIGKEQHYVVGKKDLSDLEDNFLRNMEKVGLSTVVTLLNMPNHEAVKRMNGKNIRFLFIDGDHTEAGVKKDIELFFPLLVDGAIVVFDDFTFGFPGVIKAVDYLLKEKKLSRYMMYENQFVLKYKL
jgi:predicted O-methyltransferase YrrM